MKNLNYPDPQKCRKCFEEKSLDNFYYFKQYTDRICKSCKNKHKRKHNWVRRDVSAPAAAELLRNTTKHCQLCEEEGPLYLDHCHVTGRVRGMLCFSCNVALGHLKDSETLCLKAAEYLSEKTTK